MVVVNILLLARAGTVGTVGVPVGVWLVAGVRPGPGPTVAVGEATGVAVST